jgi:hypothetical protein
MLRTNSKKYLQNIETYILDAINTEDHKINNIDTYTGAQKIAFLMACYNSEYNHKYNVRRYPNEQERFANWLAGLPSVISLPYYGDNIIILAQELQEVENFPKATEKRIIENYFNFMAYHIIKVSNKLN